MERKKKKKKVTKVDAFERARWRVKYFRWERILLMAETITFPFATEEYRGRDLFYLFRYPGNVTRDGEKSREKPFHREGVICVCLGHVTVAISK